MVIFFFIITASCTMSVLLHYHNLHYQVTGHHFVITQVISLLLNYANILKFVKWLVISLIPINKFKWILANIWFIWEVKCYSKTEESSNDITKRRVSNLAIKKSFDNMILFDNISQLTEFKKKNPNRHLVAEMYIIMTQPIQKFFQFLLDSDKYSNFILLKFFHENKYTKNNNNTKNLE